jgi:hypothetical protein
MVKKKQNKQTKRNAQRASRRAGVARTPVARLPRRQGFFGGPLPIPEPVLELELRRRGQPLDELIVIANRMDGRLLAVSPELPAFVHTEMARATKTARGAALLASQGYGPQSIVLGRTLFESLLYIRWALGHPSGVDERVRLHMRWAATVEGEAWASSGIAKFDSAPKPPLTAAERAEAKKLFGPRGTQNLTGHKTIAALVKDLLELETIDGALTQVGRVIDEGFRLMLGWADRMVHTTGISTTASLSTSTVNPDVGDLTFGPSRDNVEQALLLATTSYLTVLQVYFTHVAPDLLDALAETSCRMWRSHHDVIQLRTLKPDDPCPCDRPAGTWAQCHQQTDAHADIALEDAVLAARERQQ